MTVCSVKTAALKSSIFQVISWKVMINHRKLDPFTTILIHHTFFFAMSDLFYV